MAAGELAATIALAEIYSVRKDPSEADKVGPHCPVRAPCLCEALPPSQLHQEGYTLPCRSGIVPTVSFFSTWAP